MLPGFPLLGSFPGHGRGLRLGCGGLDQWQQSLGRGSGDVSLVLGVMFLAIRVVYSGFIVGLESGNGAEYRVDSGEIVGL